MGQRLLRDWTKSEKVDKLSANAEVLFTRLIMKADDFGIYHANTKLIKADCFPLREELKSWDIEPFLDELIKTDLITIFTADDGRKYLQIKEFGQRLRTKKSKYPHPTNGESATNGTQNDDMLRTSADNCQLEEKRREVEENKNKNTQIKNLENKKIDFYNSLIPYLDKYGKEMIRNFYDYWTELSKTGKKLRFENERFFEIGKRLATWNRNNYGTKKMNQNDSEPIKRIRKNG